MNSNKFIEYLYKNETLKHSVNIFLKSCCFNEQMDLCNLYIDNANLDSIFTYMKSTQWKDQIKTILINNSLDNQYLRGLTDKIIYNTEMQIYVN